MDYTEYTTRQGQRWDTIATETLNDPYGYPAIIELNPQWRNNSTLPGNVKLLIPVVEATEVAIAAENLPPWKR
ncbi:MAG: hypothetical protein SFY66_19835 [Oculatellaceae cyanobacterium bins.114]|nr:hypothetical protein [Oculatellaceae cyanobacterium bins.114]